MIRGHIDFVSRSRIEGWVYSDEILLTNRAVLAYVNDQCVGAGLIEVFRPDLLAAMIGDGFSGFGFPIQLDAAHDSRLLEIRLDGGNIALRQSGVAVVPRSELDFHQRRSPGPESLSWMLGRSWITQEQHDVLQQLERFGVCRHQLPASIAKLNIGEIARLATQVLQIHMQLDVTAEVKSELWDEDLPKLRSYMHAEFQASPPLVGLWAPWTNCLEVVEGSHSRQGIFEQIRGVEYEFGGETLLWLNLDTNHHAVETGLVSSLTAFTPRRTSESAVGALPNESLVSMP